MDRETRTVWWYAQGVLVYMIMAFIFAQIWFGVLFFAVHILGAIYSQYIQEAPD